MKNKKTQLKHLKKSARDSLVTLEHSKDNPNKFKASFLYFEGYLDLFTTIESLINVCILATQGDTYCPPHIKEHERDIRKTLELAAKLLPFEEGEFLDEAYNVLIKKPSGIDQEMGAKSEESKSKSKEQKDKRTKGRKDERTKG